MLFTPELAKQIALEEKWQTRRPVKDGDKLITVDGIKKVVSAAGRTKHAVGSIRTVQYAYGKPCRWWHPDKQHLLPLHRFEQLKSQNSNEQFEFLCRYEGYELFKIQITDIRQEDVRKIMHNDVEAEGFHLTHQFLRVWTGFYDPVGNKLLEQQLANMSGINLDDRPAHLYAGFAYTFKIYRNEN